MSRIDASTTVRCSRPMAPVERGPLIRRLNRLAPVTVIDCRPGSGVTTLLAQWTEQLRGAGLSVATVDLTTGPLPARHVLHRVREAMQQAGTVPDGDPGTEELPAGLVVVVDGAGGLTDRDLASLVEMLTAHRAAHLVMRAARADPVRSAAQRHGLDVDVLCGRDLAVTPEQLGELARTWGRPITAELAEVIHAEVGGWLAPARLILESTVPDADGLDVDAARAFVEAWLASIRDDAELLRLAGALAVVPTITVELAESVSQALGPSASLSGADAVARLVDLGLLNRLSCAGPSRSFAFPALVRSVLVDVVADPHDAGLRRAAHRGAATLMLERAFDDVSVLGPAVRHARQAEDWDLLRRIWSTYSLDLLNSCGPDAAWAFDRLPATVTDRWPSLAIAEAVTRCSSRGLGDEAERLLRQYARAGGLLSTAALDDTQPDEVAMAAAAAIVARRVQGRSGEALDVANWYDEQTKGRRGALKPSASVQAWFQFEWARTLLLDGDLPDSVAKSAGAFDAAVGREARPFAASGSAALTALGYTLLGSPADARRWLQHHHAAPMPDGWVSGMLALPARVSSALRAVDLLDIHHATDMVDELADCSVLDELWPLIAVVEARHAMLFGDPAHVLLKIYEGRARRDEIVRDGPASRAWIDRSVVELQIHLGELTRAHAHLGALDRDAPTFRVVDARLNLAAQRPEKARRIAAAGARSPAASARDRVHLLIIEAVCALRLDQLDDARDSFALAYALVERLEVPSAFATIPADELETLLGLVGFTLPQDVSDALHQAHPAAVGGGGLVLLTPRELEVLRQTAEWHSVADVAKALSVSVNTVKKQRASVYDKLGVNDARSAIMRAEGLGLLGPTS